MKRQIYVRKLLSPILAMAIVVVTAFGGVAFAADTNVSAKVNYADNAIEATFESDIPYVTDVMFYLLDKDDTFTGIENSKRVGVAEVIPGEAAVCAIKIGDDLPDDENDRYKIYAIAGGYDSSYKGYSESFRIMNSTNASNSLEKVNAQTTTETNIESITYEEFDDVFGFEGAPGWKGKYLYQIRVDDCSGKFNTISDVDAAWQMADVLKLINDTSASNLELVLENNKQAVGFDTTNTYYTTYKDAALTLFAGMGAKYSVAEFTDAMNKSIAVAAVNGCEIEDLDGIFKAYDDALEISEYMTRYSKVSTSDFAKQFDDFTAEDAADVKTKFENVLIQLEGIPREDDTALPIIGDKNNGVGNLSVSGGIGGATVPASKSFTDVAPSHWAYNQIVALAEMGILNGYADNTFKCDANITREEFAKVVVAAFDLKDNGGEYTAYSDVNSSHWASSFIKIASVNGVINGVGGGRFGAGQKISRQDAAVMIERAAKAKGIELGSSTSLGFADKGSVADYAKEAVGRLSGSKIINGFEDGSFRPNNSITRAETAKIVYSVLTK